MATDRRPITAEAHVAELLALVEEDAGIALTDVILTEFLQGIRRQRKAQRVEQRLRAFDVLRLERLEDFTRAVELCRTARSRGYV
ncbi:MAG: hypothetical protein BRC31_04230 [Actinobacteria bacterium QS_5_72_10]|nr:MAG: hypothetical protein BRC31_04230 [Actinobacteria bacterium QS_5_72_10]